MFVPGPAAAPEKGSADPAAQLSLKSSGRIRKPGCAHMASTYPAHAAREPETVPLIPSSATSTRPDRRRDRHSSSCARASASASVRAYLQRDEKGDGGAARRPRKRGGAEGGRRRRGPAHL